jgi:hypothetical protein
MTDPKAVQPDKDTKVLMPDGEEISLTECMCRLMEKHALENMTQKTRDELRLLLQRGATAKDIAPFFLDYLKREVTTDAEMQRLGIDMNEVFRRVHERCIKAIVD